MPASTSASGQSEKTPASPRHSSSTLSIGRSGRVPSLTLRAKADIGGLSPVALSVLYEHDHQERIPYGSGQCGSGTHLSRLHSS